MQVTHESVQENKKKYEEIIKNITKQRIQLKEKMIKLESQKAALNDRMDIAKLEFELSKVRKQVNDLTFSLKENLLTLEQISLQQNVLESDISREMYSKKIVFNREAKKKLWKEQELQACKDEVNKCEKAINLYTLIGDAVSIKKWQAALNEARKDLKQAQEEMVQENIDENREDNFSVNKEVETVQKESSSQMRYTREQNGNHFVEKWEQVIKDNISQEEIGTRVIVETTELGTGKVAIETITNLENEKVNYTIKELTKGEGQEFNTRKIITGMNKITGDEEQFSYTKDRYGNEFASKQINGKLGLRVVKGRKGTTIEKYDENGNITDSYEYDSEGKALIGFGGMDEIPKDYVEQFFARITSNVPKYDCEDKKIEEQSVLDSAVEATEKMTRTSTMEREEKDLRNYQKEKAQSR